MVNNSPNVRGQQLNRTFTSSTEPSLRAHTALGLECRLRVFVAADILLTLRQLEW